MKAKPSNLPPESWGILVRTRREEWGLTQAQLAQMVDVAQVTISRIEKGLQAPRLDLMVRLAKALGVDRLTDLFPYPDFRRGER